MALSQECIWNPTIYHCRYTDSCHHSLSLGLLLQPPSASFPSANSQHSSLSKCKIVLLVWSKLSNGFPSCSVKARFFTLVYKVPHTLAPLLPSLPPCAPFLTLCSSDEPPCSLKYQALFHPRVFALAIPSDLGILFPWEHQYGPLISCRSLSMSPYLATSYRRAVYSPHTHVLLLPAEFPP